MKNNFTYHQVSALRSAILYIRGLQALVADCDAGRLEDSVYRTSRALDTSQSGQQEAARQQSAGRKQQQGRKRGERKRAERKKQARLRGSEGKWTNYSQTFLKQRFSPGAGAGVAALPSPPLTPPGPAPTSPRDVNEISLHISLLDGPAAPPEGQVIYIYQGQG